MFDPSSVNLTTMLDPLKLESENEQHVQQVNITSSKFVNLFWCQR